MRLIIALFTCLFLMTCSANEIVNPISQNLPNDVDELGQLLSTANHNDEKLSIYWQLYKQLKYTNPKLTEEYLDLMYQLAIEEGNEEFIGKAYHGIGCLYKRNGDPIGGIKNYLDAIVHFENAKNHVASAASINNIGGIFLSNGDYDYALSYFEKAREIYVKTNDLPNQVATNINLGICYAKKTDPDYRLAAQYYDEAIALNLEKSSRQRRFYNRLYNLKGSLYYRTKMYARAVANYKQSMEYLGQGNAEELTIAYYNIGESLIGDKRFAEAGVWLRKAEKLGKDAMLDGEVMTECYNIIGALYQHQDMHDLAVANFEKAISIANKEVSNQALRRTLKMIRDSQKMLQIKGRSVDAGKLLYQADVLERQTELHDALLNEAGTSRLQAALRKEIEISGLQQKLSASVDFRKRALNYTWAAAVIILTISIIIVVGRRKHQSNQV